ncbi:hypothetical protein IJI55_00950 [Candidatus Saccharibacteria bacterium]|nr:hypothetical protein [Candidatus Saccharibacteria bacterium]
MGLHNRITEEKYNEIKKYINSRKAVKELQVLDNIVAKTFGIGLTSARNIRLTDNYQAYCERVFRFHGHPGKKGKSTHEPKIKSVPDKDFLGRATFGGVCKLDDKLEIISEDQQLLLENQLELNRKLRTYIILDSIVLILILLTTLVAAIIGGLHGN